MSIQWESALGPLGGTEHDAVSIGVPVELNELGRNAFRVRLEELVTSATVGGLREWTISEVDDFDHDHPGWERSVFLFTVDHAVQEADLDLLRRHADAAFDAARASSQQQAEAASRIIDHLRRQN